MAMTTIDDLIKNFRPRFGNDTDIGIAKSYAKVLKLRREISEHKKKVNMLSRAVAHKSAKEKELDALERRLTRELEHRAIHISPQLSPQSNDKAEAQGEN